MNTTPSLSMQLSVTSALSLAVLAAVASAQSPLLTYHGTQDGSRYGHVVCAAGDINGDTRNDFAVGAPFHDPNPEDWDAGILQIVSGAGGRRLREYRGDHFEEGAGYAITNIGDVDGDGLDDISYHELDGRFRYRGAFHVFSAAGRRLWHVDGELGYDYTGRALAGLGDLDGDGYGDIAVGEPGRDDNGNNSGRVRIFSGKARTPIHTLVGARGDEAGSALARAGDVDGDGYADLLIGLPRADQPGRSDCGAIQLVSGKSGMVLLTVYGTTAGERLGTSLDGNADVNGDGTPDFIGGSPNAASSAGKATVYDGATGAVLYTFNGAAAGDSFGKSVALGYVNGDGAADAIVGAPGVDGAAGADAGQASIYSGADGSTLHTMDGQSAGAEFGFSVDDVGDCDLDGFVDVAVGAPGNVVNGVAVGSAYVYSFGGAITPARVYYVGAGCRGTDRLRQPRLDLLGRPAIGKAYEATLTGAVAGTAVALNLGIGWNQSLGALAPDCTLLAFPMESFGSTTDSEGATRLTPFAAIPNSSALVGIEVAHQWVCIDATGNSLGATLTNSGVIRIGDS
ncbi:MAG: integrin alpha [Planctomycetota bacterium]|nr:integrin alpha [Planctomycetota bacterium]MDA0932521.1 integrin alpha [Planctomycetota bacterium]